MRVRELFAVAAVSSGCLIPVVRPPTTAELLEKCRNEARAAAYVDGGADAGAGLDAYERCKAREGLQ
jgi:hypothetical protein